MKWRTLVSSLLCVGLSYAQATPVGPSETTVTLQRVLDSTETNYPLLRAALLENDNAEADMLSAEGGFDLSWKTKATITPVGYYDALRAESTVEKPTSLWGASAFAGWRLGTGKFAVYDGKAETLQYGELRAGLNVPLWRNGPTDRRRATLWRAEMGLEIAKLSVQQQRIEFRRAAGQRYWAWVAAGQRVEIARDLLTIVTGRDSGLALRVQQGDLPAVERADNARAMAQRQAQLAQAERGLEQATIDLSLFLRGPSGKPWLAPTNTLPKGFPEPPAQWPSTEDQDAQSASAQRPEARRLKVVQEQSRVEGEYARNQMRPGIDLQIAGSQDIGRNNPLRPDLSKPVLEATVLLDVPLQTRAMQGRADAAAIQVLRAQQQEAFARDRIRADVADAHSALRKAKLRIDAARSEVRLARELETAERTRFEQGDSHLLIVNLREQQTAEAELREVDALFEYYKAATDLRAARGE